MTLDLMRHFGTRQRRSGSRQEASAFAAAALLLQVCSGRQAGGWSSGGKEGEGGDDWRLGEVLPSLLLAGLLQVVGDAIMRSRSGSQ